MSQCTSGHCDVTVNFRTLWCHSVLQDTVTSLPVVVTGATLTNCSDVRLLFKGKQIDKETDFNTSQNKKSPQVSFKSVWQRSALIGRLCASFDWRVSEASQIKFLLKFRISSFSSCPEHNIEPLEWAGHQLFLFFSFLTTSCLWRSGFAAVPPIRSVRWNHVTSASQTHTCRLTCLSVC